MSEMSGSREGGTREPRCRRRWRVGVGAVTLCVLLSSAVDGAADTDDAVERLRVLGDAWQDYRNEIAERIEEADGSTSPTGRLPTVTEAAQRARVERLRVFLSELAAIDADALPTDAAVDAAVLRTVLENALGDARFAEWQMPLNSDSSFWAPLPARRGFRTVEEYERYLSRMRDVPRYFREQIANARAGLDRGFSVPRVTLEGRDASIAAQIVDAPEESAFWKAFEEMPARIPARDAARLKQQAREVIDDAVVPAHRELRRFFREEYLPGTRTTISARALPEGEAYYAQQIAQYTTLGLDAEEIHAIGLAEVARIEAAMETVKAEAAFDGTLAEFVEHLRTDPRFVARSPDELMGVAAYTAKRADGVLADYFGFLPRHRFTIRPVPAAIAPFYTAGRGGLDACLMNTHDLPSRPLYNVPVLTLHECVPGHSFQAAVALERATTARFRRRTYFSGFGEGWGLYVEWLGNEMGIYRTPYERFGQLSYEMWRAARLVIDTGIHHYGWSRQHAIDYLADRTALSRREVLTEIDRYISWPGQALAYKLGELTMRRVRAKAEQALAEDFDIRKFHDVVLSLGSVPLPVLEARIDAFIAAGGPGLDGVSYD